MSQRLGMLGMPQKRGLQQALAGAAQVLGVPSRKPEGHGSIPGQATYLGCVQGATDGCFSCFSPSLSPSLPLPLSKVNKHVLG